MKKIITIRAFLKSCDTTSKKLTMIFLDDEIEEFTKSFLMNYYSNAQNNPIRDNEFIVKYCEKSRCFLDNARQTIGSMSDLVDNVITANVFIRHYNFTSGGKKIIGWNVNLVSMQKL